MIVNEEKKTSPKQRIIIALIAILMLGSTFALYAGIVLQYQGVGAKTVGGLTTEEQDEMQNLMTPLKSIAIVFALTMPLT